MELAHDNQERPLSKNEQSRLAELETILKNYQKSFVHVGDALAEIAESRLYRTEFGLWEDYVLEVWQMGFQRANQFIRGAKTYHHLEASMQVIKIKTSTIVEVLPTNEAQIRPLVENKLSLDEQISVWILVINLSNNEQINVTAALVKRCVVALKGKILRDNISKIKRGANKGVRVSEELQEAFNQYLENLQSELDSNWRNTSKKAVIDQLKSLLAAAEGI